MSLFGLELPFLVLWFVLATVLATITAKVADWNDMTDELVWERLAVSIWQYHSIRQKTVIYPVYSFGGFTTEMAGPATLFFLLLTAIIVGFAVVLVVGHIVWGQKF